MPEISQLSWPLSRWASRDGYDILAVSWDGVTTPIREPGKKRGRPAERPGVRGDDASPTAWKEAGVGTISVYGDAMGKSEKPERLDTLYFARMPEPGMKSLLEQQGDAVARLRAEREYREVVVLADGKSSIWKAFESMAAYAGATPILDFFHAEEHLSRAAEAISGKKSEQGRKWYDKYRRRLLEQEDSVPALIDSLRYFRKTLRKGTERDDVVRRVIQYLRTHREKMNYAALRKRGLPIGSGPVEAACKTVVGARLKRSGMRWSRVGGQQVLNLRAPVLSKRWGPLWDHYLAARAA